MGGILGGNDNYVPPAEPIEEDLSEEKARADRLDMIRRRRRGRAGTVHTSWTGDKVEIPDELSMASKTAETAEDKPSSAVTKKTPELQTTLGG